MSDNDAVRAAKVSKPKAAEKVPATEAAALEAAAPAPELEESQPELTEKERGQAEAELAKSVEPAPELRTPPTYLVKVGGRAWYRGQQIKFIAGETFTSETWEENAIAGFRECGVDIIQTA